MQRVGDPLHEPLTSELLGSDDRVQQAARNQPRYRSAKPPPGCVRCRTAWSVVRAERDVEWHEARKASKRLLYAAEAAAPALGKPAKRLVKGVKRVQELLGDHEDAVVARPVLREIGMAAHLDGENGFTYGILHQQQTDAGRLQGPDITAAWQDLRDRVRKLAA